MKKARSGKGQAQLTTKLAMRTFTPVPKLDRLPVTESIIAVGC